MLKLTLFGQPQIVFHDKPVAQDRKHAKALLFYLAWTGAAFSRSELADLFWPDNRDPQSRLREELHRLRNTWRLGDYIKEVDEKISFNRAANYEADVEIFERGVTRLRPSAKQLEAVAQLHGGPFLMDFSVDEAHRFNNLVTTKRRELARWFYKTLKCLAIYYAKQGSYPESLHLIDKLLQFAFDEHDDFEAEASAEIEAAHRLRMLVLALNGMPDEAVRHYSTYSTALEANELEPDLKTRKLSMLILDHQIHADMLRDYLPDAPLIHDPPFDVPVRLKPPTFVGREPLVSWLCERLRQPQAPNIYSVWGMSGVGKTTIAIQTAERLRDDFPDGVLWADLAVSEPITILQNWAKCYDGDLSAVSDLRERADAFRRLTAKKKILFVLDDVITVVQANALLPDQQECAVLLTTKNEDVASALNSHFIKVEPLEVTASRQLFTTMIADQARTADHRAVDTVTELLGNLPLAIEIAAQRLRSRPRLSLLEYTKRLRQADQLDGLQVGDRAVRMAFEPSWERLIERHQCLFAHLAVFERRPFTVDAAAFVTDLAPEQVGSDLADLYALSLVIEVDREQYQLHTLLAAFAHEKLEGMFANDAATSRTRMAQYFLGFAHHHSADPAALEAEWGHLSAGIMAAFEQQQWPLVIDYAQALHGAWFNLGRYDEAHQWLEWACEAALNLGDQSCEAWVTCQQGRTFVEQNDGENAVPVLEHALSLYQQLNDRQGMMDVMYYLGRIHVVQDNYVEAERLLGQVIDFRRQHEDWSGVAEAYYILADIPFNNRDFDAAQHLANEALHFYSLSASTVGEIKCRGLLADIAFNEGRLDDAERYYVEALELCEALYEWAERAIILYGLSDVYLLNQKVEAALDTIAKSVVQLERMGDTLNHARALRLNASIYMAMSAPESALGLALVSLNLFERSGSRRNIARTHNLLGDIWLASAQIEKTLMAYYQGLTLYIELGMADKASAIEAKIARINGPQTI